MLHHNNSEKSVLVIGCSSFGKAIAVAAYEHNFHVTVVDLVESSFERLPAPFKGFTVIGDGMEAATLESAGIISADIVVAATNDDDANIMIAQIATTHFNRKQVLAMVSDLNKKSFCDSLAIACICPALLAVRQAESIVLKTGEAEE